jgi:hypothetical protein
MFEYLNFSKLNIVSPARLNGVSRSGGNFDIRYSNLFVAFLILNSLFLILAPAGARAMPSAADIKQLDPTEIFYATPFDGSIDGALASNSQALYPEDIVTVFPRLDWGLGGKLAIWRAPSYSIVDGKKQLVVRSWGLGVAEVLADKGIEIGEQDKVVPPLDTKISKGMTVQIIRVSQTELKETESMDFKIIDRDDATLERGVVKVQQEGGKGQREKVYAVKREDGEEVSRSLISNVVTKQPKDKIILHGTKIIILSSETGESSWTFGVTASRKYKKGTLIRVTNLANGKVVETTVGGYGPMTSTGRILDLNVDSWEQIAKAGAGTTTVKVEEIKQ